MTKQDFLAALERALAKLPHAEAQQAIAFYDEAISDRVEDGMSEDDAVASLGDVDEIARQIASEIPPIPRAIAKANTGSRTLNIVLLALFSPVWVPVAGALALAALCIYLAIWLIIAAMWMLVVILIGMGPLGLFVFANILARGFVLSSFFALGLCLMACGAGLLATFGVMGVSKQLALLTRNFARWVRGLFVKADPVPAPVDVDAPANTPCDLSGNSSSASPRFERRCPECVTLRRPCS